MSNLTQWTNARVGGLLMIQPMLTARCLGAIIPPSLGDGEATFVTFGIRQSAAPSPRAHIVYIAVIRNPSILN